ncbi:MAG: beta-ketoacyl-ACP synthase II [Desulfovibrionaceae bacterium]|nr:beta-ketoacyl-ACP synthase II [Desulfovibrionaceae bacterium]
MSKKRVVVTGLSAISPLGNDLESSWRNLLEGRSGIRPITAFDAGAFDAKIAGEVRDFNPEDFGIPVKQARRMDRFVQLAVAAGNALVQHSGYAVTEENTDDTAVCLGIGLGGLSTLEVFHSKLRDSGPSRVSPFYIPMLISNMAPGQISIFTGIKGPNLVVTSACASSLHAIGYAYSDILLGRCKAAVTGGVEATITPMGISGFTAMKALCTRNDEPERASRPFDMDRSGFVMGEGAGFLFIEELESAKARGASIYAEIIGFGASGDAYHMTAPQEDGRGMASSMSRALRDAGLSPEDVDHVNAHGTSTHLNDLCETKAIKQVFGKHAYTIPVVSNKSQVGHLLGGAGGIESVFSVLTLFHGIVPGTANYETPDPECDLNYMGKGPEKRAVRTVLCNDFGFGGTNGSIIYKRWEGK